MTKEISYTEALQELTHITEELENENTSIDELAEKVKRASFLIRLCKNKIRETEDEIGQVIQDMKDPE